VRRKEPVVTKIDLAGLLVEKTGLTRAEASKFLSALAEAVQESLRKGRKVRLSGIGILSVYQRGPSTRRNPKTGERIAVPPRKRVRFRASQELKRLLNE